MIIFIILAGIIGAIVLAPTFPVEEGFIDEGQILTIPQGNYFVMGDNREHSADSRLWGYVPKENIIGKVTLCYANCTPKEISSPITN